MLLASQTTDHYEIADVAERSHLAKRPPQEGALPASIYPSHVPSHYAGSTNRPALVLIAILHIAAIALFVKYDVLTVAHKRADPVMIELQPLAEAPPPQQQQKPQETTRQIETPIVTPPPIVQTATAAPPLVTTPVAPPVTPQAIAAPAAPAVIAAPIVPPDASAANLGNAPPRYPVESRRSHEEGTVRLRVLISPEGAVEEISLARTSGFDRLDKAALETVRKWRFRAGSQAGKPVEAIGYLSIPFVLSH